MEGFGGSSGTLLVFYYEKLVGYMPSYFADLVFTGERIEVCLKRGKFDYVSPAGTNNRRIGAVGAKRKEGDAYAVTSAPAWPKPQQASHGHFWWKQPSSLGRAGRAGWQPPPFFPL